MDAARCTMPASGAFAPHGADEVRCHVCNAVVLVRDPRALNDGAPDHEDAAMPPEEGDNEAASDSGEGSATGGSSGDGGEGSDGGGTEADAPSAPATPKPKRAPKPRWTIADLERKSERLAVRKQVLSIIPSIGARRAEKILELYPSFVNALAGSNDQPSAKPGCPTSSARRFESHRTASQSRIRRLELDELASVPIRGDVTLGEDSAAAILKILA